MEQIIDEVEENGCQVCLNEKIKISEQTNDYGVTLQVCDLCSPFGSNYDENQWIKDEGEIGCEICGNVEEYISTHTCNEVTMQVCEHCAPGGSFHDEDAW